MAILCASAAGLIIIVNAVFLQSGSHPAPFFANPTRLPQKFNERFTGSGSAPAGPATRSPEAASMRPAQTAHGAQAIARHNDPIADLIAASAASPARIMAVQRVLSEFGYGQLRLTGTLDAPTSAAIQKFESEHKLPVTGRLSERLLSELAALAGRPIE